MLYGQIADSVIPPLPASPSPPFIVATYMCTTREQGWLVGEAISKLIITLLDSTCAQLERKEKKYATKAPLCRSCGGV